MTPLVLGATTVASAIGLGKAATLASLQAGRTGLSPSDFAGATRRGHIGRAAGLDAWEMTPGFEPFACRNNALADMALQADDFAGHVAAARERYGAGRIATVVGTSTSGILAAEEAYRARGPDGALPRDFDYADTYDLFSLARFVAGRLGLRGPAMTVSTACASSARAFIDAQHLIASGMADAAVVGGSDSLCRLTLHGFASLDLISDEPCRPCDASRTGISIGEAAGFALLERRADAPGGTVALLGTGASSDGYHMSSPRPDGAGAARAMRQALQSANLAASDIDYVNLHGTGTRANDAMEDQAVCTIFGPDTPCSSTKGFTGHTMGSCGIVEAVIASLCIAHDFAPACLGMREPDPAFGMRVLARNTPLRIDRVMSNAFGFGGVNCSLLFGAL